MDTVRTCQLVLSKLMNMDDSQCGPNVKRNPLMNICQDYHRSSLDCTAKHCRAFIDDVKAYSGYYTCTPSKSPPIAGTSSQYVGYFYARNVIVMPTVTKRHQSFFKQFILRYCSNDSSYTGDSRLLWWLGGVVVGRWTCDFRVAGSSPGHDTAWLFLR